MIFFALSAYNCWILISTAFWGLLSKGMDAFLQLCVKPVDWLGWMVEKMETHDLPVLSTDFVNEFGFARSKP